jgi:hypothetical protein
MSSKSATPVGAGLRSGYALPSSRPHRHVLILIVVGSHLDCRRPFGCATCTFGIGYVSCSRLALTADLVLRTDSRLASRQDHLSSCTAARRGVVCEGCLHRTPVAFVPLIIRWGPDASSDMLRRSARCTKCGRKGAALQHPSWARMDIGFEPFPVLRPCAVGATTRFVESPGRISPPGAPRTVREPLDSHGSRCSAVAMA